MTTRALQVIGGNGIHVHFMSGIYIVELDPNVIQTPLGDGGDSPPSGVFDESQCTKLLYTGSHSNDADTQTWTNTTQNKGLQMTVQTATVYDPAGDRVLYSMVRDLSFDSWGQLINVSAERKVTIDTTEGCA